MDLSRSVETIIFPSRRVDSAPTTRRTGPSCSSRRPGADDRRGPVLLASPTGTQEQNLTTQPDACSERNPRIDPFARTVVFEQIDETGVSRIYLFREHPAHERPGDGAGAARARPTSWAPTPTPSSRPTARRSPSRRLTGTGNGGLGTWDLLTLKADGASPPVVIATGPVYRGAPDWGSSGILFVETDAAAWPVAARAASSPTARDAPCSAPRTRAAGWARPAGSRAATGADERAVGLGTRRTGLRKSPNRGKPVRFERDSGTLARERVRQPADHERRQHERREGQRPKRRRSRVVSRRSVANTVDTRPEKTSRVTRCERITCRALPARCRARRE